MSFLALMTTLATMAWLAGLILRRPLGLRDAMRLGAAGAFLLTGVDHFLSVDSRYLPMMPAFFGASARPLVLFTGAAELAGALGLLIPLATCARLGLPKLRRAAGLALALLLVALVMANINVAIQGERVEGFDFGRWYYWLRPACQPVIIYWVLYAAGVVRAAPSPAREASGQAHAV